LRVPYVEQIPQLGLKGVLIMPGPAPALTTNSPRNWIARIVRWFFTMVAILLVLFLGYTWMVLHWSYSRGERAGYVQKFSQRGLISKTWEGELAMVSMPGTTPEKFYFSVRDDSVAVRVNASLGKRVALVYEQHVGVPTTIFGETEYFVTDVKLIE
jgi:hypothetical protein